LTFLLEFIASAVSGLVNFPGVINAYQINKRKQATFRFPDVLPYDPVASLIPPFASTHP
jgi:hypothetical protein